MVQSGKTMKIFIEKAIKVSDRWKNREEDGLTDKEISATFDVKTKMKVFAWNVKKGKRYSNDSCGFDQILPANGTGEFYGHGPGNR